MARSTFKLAKKDVALVAATDKNLLAYTAPAGQKVLLKRFTLAFDGVNASANHVEATVLRATGTGTGGTDVTADAAPNHVGNPTVPRGVFRQAATGGFTDGLVLDRRKIHPTSGYDDVYSLGEETEVAPGETVILRANAPAGVNVDCDAVVEE